MTNKEIEDKLLLRDNEEDVKDGHSVNAEMFKKYIKHWNNAEYEFPIDDIKRYIRLNEWTQKDFSFENELLISKYLPPFIHDVFFELKSFRENSRNELVSDQKAFARIMGYPMNTQDEKAFCIYEYALQLFYNRSEIHREDQNV